MRYVEAEAGIGRQAPNLHNGAGEGPYISATHPDQIYGEPWHETVESQYEISPHGEAAGFGFDLGGYSRKTAFERQYRWNFTLQKHSGIDGEYTKLAWKWEGQRKGSPHPFERPIHAAVVVGHDRSPFTIQTYIRGKFESRRQGWRNLMVEPAEGRVVPLIPDPKALILEDLTTTIEELQQSIEERNRSQAPIGKFPLNPYMLAALTRTQNC